MNIFTPQMMGLFAGNSKAYGKFTYSEKIRNDGKIKGTGITIRRDIHSSNWDDHLDGREQLGIIPINMESTTKFGAIDIDDYSVNREEILKRIVKHNLPLTMFRSKSGGAHLFLFTSDFVPALLMQNLLRELAAFVGHGQAEIFPKQTQILEERGDIGQWINMPYFDMINTERYAYNDVTGVKMGIGEFIMNIGPKIYNPEQFRKYESPVSKEELPNGPPCLQQLAKEGFPDGTRNQGLFALGVYAQKVSPDGWQKLIESYNEKFMNPPLPPSETLVIIKSLTKKEYQYPCKKIPICNHCNMSLCRTRKYGIGENSGMPLLGALTKLETDPPLWFIDIDTGGRIELSTEELQNPRKFQLKCLERLNIMPVVPTAQVWNALIANLLQSVVIIPVSKELTIAGQLLQLVEEFCTIRASDEEPDCLLRGVIWNNESLHHFRFRDLQEFLERKKFYRLEQNQVLSILKENGVRNRSVNLPSGKHLTTLSMPYFTKELEKITLSVPSIPSVKDIPF